jgi:hypothetical protein
LRALPPAAELDFRMQDAQLRLLVGADTGSGELYGYREHDLSAGSKRCVVHMSAEGQLVLISSAGPRS